MTAGGGTRRFALLLLGLFATGLAVRVAFVLLVDPEVPAVGDATAYHLLAEQIADGEGYLRPFDRAELGVDRATAEYPPLWPATVAVAPAGGVHSVTGQRLFASLVGSVAVVVTGLLGRRVGGPAVGLTAAAVIALHPLVLQSPATLMPETLFVGLVAAVLLLAERLGRGAAPPWAPVLLGVLGGLATLTRAEGALVVLLVVLPSLRRPRGLRTVALVAVGALLVVGPWTLRNAARFDALVPVSNNLGTALDGANCDEVYHGSNIGMWSYSPSCFQGFDQSRLAAEGEAAVAADHRDEGLDHAVDDATRLPVVLAARVLRTWGAWDPAQTTFAAATEGRVLGWERAGTALHLLLLVPGSAVGIWRLRHRRLALWILLAPLLTVTVTAALTYGNQRFRAGAEPALAVLAAVGLWTLVEAVRGHRSRDPGAGAPDGHDPGPGAPDGHDPRPGAPDDRDPGAGAPDGTVSRR